MLERPTLDGLLSMAAIVGLLIEYGADPNRPSDHLHDTTALIVVSATAKADPGYLDIAKALLANGARHSWIDGEGRTPVGAASTVKMEVLLREWGAIE